jgi:hypothetical protein
MNTATPSRLRQRLRGDRGSTTVEMVSFWAVKLLAWLVVVQAAVWGLAVLACMYAANHAVQVTRIDGGSAAAGQSDAIAVLDLLGPVVTNRQATASRNTTTATVTVSGTALRVVPFVTLPVHASATGPVERIG